MPSIAIRPPKLETLEPELWELAVYLEQKALLTDAQAKYTAYNSMKERLEHQQYLDGVRQNAFLAAAHCRMADAWLHDYNLAYPYKEGNSA